MKSPGFHNYRILLGLFIIFCSTTNIYAQQPLNVNVVLTPPYPNYADELINLGEEAIITIQNTDFQNAYEVKLGMTVDGSGGVSINTKEDALPAQSLQVNPGETLILTGTELSSFYNSYTQNDFEFSGITAQEIINDQSLPDGLYTVCIRAFDYFTNAPLSAPAPSGCAAPFTVVTIDPPIITNPVNQEIVNPIEPQLLNISWIPVSIALPDLRYRLEMVDVSDGPINPYDAFSTPDFLFFFEEGIFTNSFLYGLEHPALELGNQYAVRVRAYREDGLLNINNQGYSDIVIFTYGEADDDESETIILGQTDGTGNLPQQDLDCGGDCNVFVPVGGETGTISPGSTVQIGHFDLYISTASGSGTYTGTGVIQPTDYMPVGIKVSFNNLQVNANNRVISGKATADIRAESWVDQTWSDVNAFGQNQNINFNNLSEAWDAGTDPNFYLENLEAAYQQVGTTLPVLIGSDNHKLQVVGMEFNPGRAAYNLAYFQKINDDVHGERYLSFIGRDLCITPAGPAVGADEASLDLVKDIRFTFDNKTSLTFAAHQTASQGTQVKFDCSGFVGIEASGWARFDPSVIKAVDDEGNQIADTVAAAFTASYTDWADWIAYIDFLNVPQDDPTAGNDDRFFQYQELDDYTLKLTNAYMDHSISDNHPTMVFPENFNGVTSADWQGVYVEEIQMLLPEFIESYESEDKRVSLAGYDLLIDSDGLTGKIEAENVLTQEEGTLGSWKFSLNTISIEITANELHNANFQGSLKIPIIEEPFDYEANVQYLPLGTLHTFDLNTTGDYTVPVWFAEATLAENSNITVNVAEDLLAVEATLNGTLSFAPVIGDIDKNNLTDITFDDLIIRNKKAPKYVEIGHIGTGVTAQSLALAGFGAIIDHIEWDEGSAEEAGLLLGVGVDLAGGLGSISGGTELFMKTKIENYADSVAFIRDGTSITGIYLEAETGACNITGTINYFKDNSIFGSGFDGSVEVAFLESIRIDGNVLFGNKPEGNESFNYWYAFAMVSLPNTPAPLATPVDIYGFGGGLYFNMAINQDMPNPQAIGGTTVNPREAFVPSQGMAGIQASVVLALTPSTRTFNADVTLTAQINLNTWGLNLINFTGAGYVMQKMDEPNKEEAMVAVTVVIEYDFPAETLSAEMGVTGDIPKSNPLLSISGDIVFYRSPSLWYFKAGIPTDQLTTTIDLGLAGINAGAYFMTGQNLPPPVLPAEVQKFFNFNSTLANNMANNLGIGFLAGVHLGLNIDLMALGTGLEITALAGVDISLMHWYAALCNGNENFGVHKWYAMGQGYLYGKILFKLAGFKAASITAGIILEGAFPNPTGVNGMVKAELEILGGIISESVEQSFSLGSMCNMTPIDIEELVESGDFDRPETELEDIDMIGQITPSNHANYISTGVQPSVEFLVKSEKKKNYAYGDGMGGLIQKEFKFSTNAYWMKETENGDWSGSFDYQSEYDEDNYVYTLSPVNSAGDPALINGSTRYKIGALAVIKEKKDGVWEDALYLEGPNQGEPISQRKEHIFTTTTNLTEIDHLFVDYTLPYDRQRYYPYNHLDRGHVKFNVDHEAKFQDFEECGFEIFTEFEPVNGGNVQRVEVTRENLLKIRYDIANLAPSTIYEMRVIAERETTPAELEDEDNANCQLPNDDIFEDRYAIA
ncbi:MAG: hypothetical protein LC664_11715 [Flavobacteriales bacterium]|nr:hypothetical protein [Flavobacteriales bacterium]